METGRTTAVVTRTSSRCLAKDGTSHPPSGPGAARQSTPTASVSFGDARLPLDAGTVMSLLCVLEGYMANTLSGDVTALAFMSAKDTAKRKGVPEEKFVEVANAVFKVNDGRRRRHPWVASGFMA